MKQALIAVGVFAALLVVVLVTRDGGNVNVGVPKLELPTVDAAQITAIEISGAQTASLKKEASGWVVAGPSKAFHPADEAQVGQLREAIAQLKAGEFVTDRPQRIAELELDEAKGLGLKVFTSAAAPALEVVFGKAGKLGGTYLRAPKSEAVFLTRASVPGLARRDANGWRKRAFFPATADQVSKLRVKLEQGTPLELELKSDGAWASVTALPAGFRFDPAAAAGLVSSLVNTSAVEFVDEASDAPLTAATIEADLKDGKKVVLHLGAPNADKVPARIDGDPQLYLIPADHAARLKKQLTDLRDTHLLAFEPDKVKKLVIVAGGKRTVVVKEAGAWKLVEPKEPGIEFDPARVNGQLAALKMLEAARVEAATEAKAGLGKPSATLEVTLEGAPTQTVRFGGPTASGQLYVKGSADALIYAIDVAERTRWEAGPELFKKLPQRDLSQMKGLENLPPEIRRQLEAQLRQQPPH